MYYILRGSHQYLEPVKNDSTYSYLQLKNNHKITKYSTRLYNSAKQILKLGRCRSHSTSSGKMLIHHLAPNLF